MTSSSTSSLLTSPPGALRKPVGTPYIKVWLDSQTPAVLPMQHIQEVLSLPASRLTAMPTTPMAMLGLINRRSRVMWLIDFGLLLGRSRLEPNLREYDLVVVRADSITIGLAVQKIEGMVWVKPETIQPTPDHLAANLLGYLEGCVIQEDEVLWVFNAKSIVRSPILHQQH
jgi:positive phototaxis protein PixI